MQTPINPPSQLTEQADMIQLDLPANHRYLNVLGACIDAVLTRVEGIGDQESLSYAVQLAVHEACTNIIDHAYKGREDGRIQVVVALQLVSNPFRIVIELHDTGVPFDPSLVPAPNLDEPHEHGYGLYLMRELMDEITFSTNSRGNTCRLLKNF